MRGDPLGRQHGPFLSAVEVLQDAVANAQEADAICLQEQRTKHTGNKQTYQADRQDRQIKFKLKGPISQILFWIAANSNDEAILEYMMSCTARKQLAPLSVFYSDVRAVAFLAILSTSFSITVVMDFRR